MPVDELAVVVPTEPAPFVEVAYSPYASQRPASIDLGYIGDSPIGLGPQPRHELQEWEKPFRLDRGWSRGWGRVGRR